MLNAKTLFTVTFTRELLAPHCSREYFWARRR